MTDTLYIIRAWLELLFLCLWAYAFARSLPGAIRHRDSGSMGLSFLFFCLALINLPIATISLGHVYFEGQRDLWINPVLILADLSLVLANAAVLLLLLNKSQSQKLAEYFRLFKMSDREITEKLAEEQQKNTSLKRLIADLEHFVYAAAHDLRTPLRAVTGFIDLIEEEADTPPNPEYMEHIKAGAQKMLALIDSLAAYSKLEAEQTQSEPVNLSLLIASVLDDFKEVILEKGINIDLDPLPTIHGSAPKLAQLFQNLIDNAIKFGGDRIVISYNRQTRTFLVSDNGIGIDPDYHDKVFGIFQRLNREEEYPGTGMGLAICRKVVAQHGGTIGVVDSQPGQGTTFCFTLPGRVEERN